MAGSFTLGKNERLKSRKSIEQLFKGGKSFMLPPFRVYYLQPGEAAAVLQFGAGVSSRHFKRAVDRNRVKRLMREAWRLQKNALQQALQEQNRKLSVFFIYTARELPVYTEVYEKTGKALEKLSRTILLPK